MVWEQDKLHLQLLEVLYLEEESVVMRTRARPFYALSLRTRGDTEIALSEKSIQLGERDLALFSPNIAYTRYSRDDSKYVFHFSMHTQEYRTDKTPEIEILHDFRYDILLPLFVEACRIWNSCCGWLTSSKPLAMAPGCAFFTSCWRRRFACATWRRCWA